MNATELYESGQLQAAIDRQIQEVRANPADAPKRLFLFDLVAFSGDLERARRQIDAINTDDVQEQSAIAGYRRLLESEKRRREVFEGKARPKFLQAAPEHVELRLEAVLLLSQGKTAEAVAVLAKAAALTPELKGTLNEEAFEILVDCDDVFGTVLEVMANGEYFWVPLEHAELITLVEPKYPIDLLWRRGHLETAQSRGEVFLPTLYPGSHLHSNDQIRLGRLTDWEAPEGSPVRGVGVHTYLAGERDLSILEWKELAIETEPTAPHDVEVVSEAEGQEPQPEA